jgi:hypothetical protein
MPVTHGYRLSVSLTPCLGRRPVSAQAEMVNARAIWLFPPLAYTICSWPEKDVPSAVSGSSSQ